MWDDLIQGAIGAVVLVDTRRLADSFPAVDYFEASGLPFVDRHQRVPRRSSRTGRGTSARRWRSRRTSRSYRATRGTASRPRRPWSPWSSTPCRCRPPDGTDTCCWLLHDQHSFSRGPGGGRGQVCLRQPRQRPPGPDRGVRARLRPTVARTSSRGSSCARIEMVALSAAHAYAMVTGEPQAVIVHVDVGTQTLSGGVSNAMRGRVPVLIFAGAVPVHPRGRAARRPERVHPLDPGRPRPARHPAQLRQVRQRGPHRPQRQAARAARACRSPAASRRARCT